MVICHCEDLGRRRQLVISSGMHRDYHIPVPHLAPTSAELSWAEHNLLPHAMVALDKLHQHYGPKFDKADLDQSLFRNWTLAARMRDHLYLLGLELRRFCIFIGYQGAKSAVPHVDAHTIDVPMVARLNVPLQGIHGVNLSWWSTGVEDPRMLVRRFEQWDSTQNKMRSAFSYLSEPTADWGEPAHTERDPGPCWNRVERAHRLDLDNTMEHRINVTAELAEQISWGDLVVRLSGAGYIK